MSDGRNNLSIDFHFKSELDMADFYRWKAAHTEAEPEQIIAHAKANGAYKATLGDGTEWEFGRVAPAERQEP